MLATIAVVAAGYDARETPREEPSVWAMRSSGQYARVNTLTAEIDTVRRVDEPSGVIQAGARGAVLSHGDGRVWPIDPAMPRDLVEDAGADGGHESAETVLSGSEGAGSDADPGSDAGSGPASGEAPSAMRAPDGTRDTVVAGDAVLFRTDGGEVFLSRFAGEGGEVIADPMLLDPSADPAADDAGDAGDGRDGQTDAASDDAAGARFAADAAALDADGRLVMFSAEAGELRWYDVNLGRFTETEEAPPDAGEGAQLAIVAGEWVLLDAESGRLWREGSGRPVEFGVGGDALLQASSTAGASTAGASPGRAEGAGLGDSEALVADGSGLWSVSAQGAERIAEAAGVPTQPTQVGAGRYAAWLGPSGASLWSAAEGLKPLELDGAVELPGQPDPVFRSNGTSGLLSEQSTGMMWTLPEGRLIPVEQWSLVEPPKERSGTVVVADATEQEPPVAVADSFGVRAGEPAQLPVLLNDYDPNRKDVLTIVPDGLGDDLTPGFGAVSLLPDAQSIVIHPAADAGGSATFSYRITDGVHVSEPATVALTVAEPGTNSAPQWCPVEGCQREWPSPELAPGGTLVLPGLEGWVDPEGDPMMLESARAVNAEDPVRVLVSGDGRLALRHSDPNAADGDVAVRVRVADARGDATERDLVVQIRSGASAEMSPIASTAVVGESAVVRPLSRITGGSGSFALTDARVQSGSADVGVNVAAGTIEVSARQPGAILVAITARDTGTDAEITGTLRVTALESRPELGLPPLRAFVRPLADTTIDVLDAVPGANARALVVNAATVVDGELSADVLDHAQVRVSGSTLDGAAGRIGSADITVEEGDRVSTARLTVFQVPETSEGGAIAVADSITVRAGAVADIPVLDNDVAPPGQRLVLHPQIGGSGAKGELAFASGNVLRYLAPSDPGTYTLTYTGYGASTPEASDVGEVRVTVLPREGNRDPQPAPLTVRLAPGERSTVRVPLSGVDPDGDRVRLVGVEATEGAQVTASVVSRSAAVQVEASAGAQPGVEMLGYTVRDEFGGEAEGRLRVILVEETGGSRAPVAFSDYVRMTKGAASPAVVRPLDNDADPAGGRLELVEVVPNVPGGEGSAQYRDLQQRLDLSQLEEGRVTVRAADEIGTVSYRYTARSTESSSTADGLIVVQVSSRVGQQAPVVQDTVLSARDRTELERGGVDVVTDRVRWAAGDPSTLRLSVWGSAADRFSVDGSRISGEYRAEGDLVPFELAGEDASGAEVRSFGFLVIPPLDELRLTLKPGVGPLSVDEGESIEAQLADLVDLASGDRAEFRVGAFPVRRDQASCEATSASSLRYTAGEDGPWGDSCLISVKLVEQRAWTQLAVPVQIVPDEPVAELEPLTRTVAPGASQTIDLTDMVRWQGGREGDLGSLRFSVSGGGDRFEVQQRGSKLEVEARADAVPGREDALVVSVASGEGSSAPLALRVGTAAKDSPRGASVALNCTVGSACGAQLIGAPGEHDPFAGKKGGGLKLESIDGSGCAVASLRISGDGVSASWPRGDGGPGGECTAVYTVSDAQGRTGQGRIELDARGVPRAPVGVAPLSADGSSVALSVRLSGEASHPAVTGVELLTGGGEPVGSCSLAGSQATCTVSGLEPGERRTYFARAVNEVGASERSAGGAQTWAYVPPAPPSITAEAVKWPENTRSDRGRVRATIGESRAAVRVLTIDGVETPIAGDGVYELSAGQPHILRVVAADRPGMIPPGYTGQDGGRGAANSAKVTPIGAPAAPRSALLTATGANETGWLFDTAGFERGGGDELEFDFGLQEGRTAPDCTGSTKSGDRLPPFKYFTGAVCASNSFGRTAAIGTNSIFTGGAVPAPNEARYTISSVPSPASSETSVTYAAVAPDESAMVTVEGGTIVWDVPVSEVTPNRPDARARQCVDGGNRCSVDAATVGPPRGKTPFTVSWKGGGCIDPASDPSRWGSRFSIDGKPGATPSYSLSGTNDVLVSWSTDYEPAIFTGKVCDPPPDPGGSDAGSDSGSDAGAEGGGADTGGEPPGDPDPPTLYQPTP
ncbi:hypothetical protein KVY00_10965 [Leucobacter tenebrionis]|nr:hypothetical protein KVY00_10965 [Leucobacter tenebrionis]